MTLLNDDDITEYMRDISDNSLLSKPPVPCELIRVLEHLLSQTESMQNEIDAMTEDN